MSTSTVKLYYSGGTYGNWELNPGRLLKLDSIAGYLAGKTAVTKSAFQYVKNALEVSIKVDLSQSISSPKVIETFKYCSIQNTDEQIHYYFIKKANWKALSCVEFELVLDVLNTFVEGTDYSFKASTNIIREHKNRIKVGTHKVTFVSDGVGDYSGWFDAGDEVWWEDDAAPGEDHFHGKVTGITETGIEIEFESDWTQKDFDQWYEEAGRPLVTDGNDWIMYINLKIVDVVDNWLRAIDYVPEGINPLLQCKDGIGEEIYDEAPLAQSWHLLYRNANDPDPDDLTNPVECYLIPDELTTCKVSVITAGKILPSSLVSGNYYAFRIDDGAPADYLTLSDGTNIGAPPIRMGSPQRRYVIIWKDSDDRILVSLVEGQLLGLDDTAFYVGTYECEYFICNYMPVAYVRNNALPDNSGSLAAWQTWLQGGTSGQWNNTTTTQFLSGINDLDRVDPKNIKLIKLPYCPYDFEHSINRIDVSGDYNWEVASITQTGEGFSTIYALKLKNQNTKLISHITTASNPFSKLWISYEIQQNPPSKSDLRRDSSYEPKLLSSEFYQPTYYYDSFAFKVNLEKCDADKYSEDGVAQSTMNFTFTMTKTINSRFMFTFTDYLLKHSESNYAKILPIIRNNEEVLYNVPYVNYIRTGFNYDVKAKNLQIASNVAGLTLSGAGLFAAMLVPSVPLKVAAIMGSLASFAISAKNAVVSAKNAENSLEAKLKQAENEKASVQGADDVDLMTEYTGNRLRYIDYEPYPHMKNTLFNLFFYSGYRSDRMGLPNHNTRINFDYLECNPQFENIRSIPEDCLIELANCFKSGVTYLHYNNQITGNYDFDQSHENWERFLFE